MSHKTKRWPAKQAIRMDSNKEICFQWTLLTFRIIGPPPLITERLSRTWSGTRCSTHTYTKEGQLSTRSNRQPQEITPRWKGTGLKEKTRSWLRLLGSTVVRTGRKLPRVWREGLMFNAFIDGKRCSTLRWLRDLGLTSKIDSSCTWSTSMGLKSGPRLPTISLGESESNAEKDGTTISIQWLRGRPPGPEKRNGSFICSTETKQTNGLTSQIFSKAGPTTPSRIIGTPAWKKESRRSETNSPKSSKR